MRNINSIHDKFIRSKLSNLAIAKSFLQHHLPAAIRDKIDFNTLRLCPGSFVEPELRNSITDILYSVKLDGHTVYLYLLIEHQSRSVRLMPFRMYRYILNAMQDHLNRTKGEVLPIIYPIVFYTGKQPYAHSNDIYDLFENKELAKQIVFQPFQLIDLSQIADEELQQHQRASLMQLAAKHIRDRNLLKFLPIIKAILQDFDKRGYGDEICLVVEYILQAGKGNGEIIDSIAEVLSEEARGKVMTIADHLRQEGMHEGIQKGIQEGVQKGRFEEKLNFAKKLLDKGLDPKSIEELTELPVNKINELKERVIC